MASRQQKRSANGSGNLTEVSPVDQETPGLVRVIIETPKGSRNKYAFDPSLRLFTLKKVLPAGMAFPYDFGFVPSTQADDGDPIDVLVLMDEPAFPGCMLTCRLIGVFTGENVEKNKKPVRNDRIIAIEVASHLFADVARLDDLGTSFAAELEAFFVNYHKLSEKQFRVLDRKGPDAARKLIDRARRSSSNAGTA